MFWFKKKIKELRVPKISFVCEQDGDVECNFKNKIIPLLNERDYVQSAYLARVTYGDSNKLNVALCVRMEQKEDESLRRAIVDIFSAMFNRKEHLDMIFLRDEQENELRNVCSSFYEKNK